MDSGGEGPARPAVQMLQPELGGGAGQLPRNSDFEAQDAVQPSHTAAADGRSGVIGQEGERGLAETSG